MSLHAPFLVKQYLSDDLESGSYSRIFWYYPLDSLRAQSGGIGLFFEVLSGDVDDSVYEQITKRFWETFNDHFYTVGFEQALKTSIKMFIQLLRNFNVEEGIDVNIVLANVVPSEKGYMLKLISFGDADIFVVRNSKFADMGKLVPTNASLYDLKFLEVELDRGDVLMLGNKTLLRNAFEADMLAMTSLEALLQSLESFRENLFGSKKLFLIALGDAEVAGTTSVQKNGISSPIDRAKAVYSSFVTSVGTFFDRFKKKKEEDVPVEVSQPKLVTEKATLPIEPNIEPQEVVQPAPEIDELEFEGKEQETVAESPLEKNNNVQGFVAPPPVIRARNSEVVAEEESEEIVESVANRSVSFDDFEVTEEVTTAMILDKGTYQEIVDDAVKEEEEKKSEVESISDVLTPDEKLKKFTSQDWGDETISEEPAPIIKQESTLPVKAQPIGRISNGNVRSNNYVQELKSMHSPWAKISRHPTVRSAIAMVSGLFRLLIEKILSLVGKKSTDTTQKMYLSGKPSVLWPKKIAPGFWLIFVIVVVFVIWRISATNAQNKLEKSLLTEIQQVQSKFVSFYEQNIVPIDKEDTEKQLELCAAEAQPVFDKEKAIIGKIKTDKVKQSIAAIVSEVTAKVGECNSKYDRVNGIVRISDAELVKNFTIELGNDSNITTFAIRSNQLVVADSGRKAIYQVNIATRGVLKLEDPLGLITTPTAVGVGEGTLFVCDKQNGVLYYTPNAANGKDGFNRMVGTEPATIGECMKVDGFGKNAYVVPNTANVLYRIEAKGAGYAAPKRYMEELMGVRSVSIDGKIYVISVENGVGSIAQYYGGKKDNFTMPAAASLGELTASFTNPSNDKPLYVYDKTKNAVLVIEKPAADRHPGRGVVLKTYMFENADKFKDIKAIAVDLNENNQEVTMYVLAGTSIFKFALR